MEAAIVNGSGGDDESGCFRGRSDADARGITTGRWVGLESVGYDSRADRTFLDRWVLAGIVGDAGGVLGSCTAGTGIGDGVGGDEISLCECFGFEVETDDGCEELLA